MRALQSYAATQGYRLFMRERLDLQNPLLTCRNRATLNVLGVARVIACPKETNALSALPA